MVYEIHWVGWNTSIKDGTQHDKVWGWLKMRDGRLYAFWGRRGKTLRFKQHHDQFALEKLQGQKNKKGYDYVSADQYNKLVKDFIDDVEIYCTTAILADTVM